MLVELVEDVEVDALVVATEADEVLVPLHGILFSRVLQQRSGQETAQDSERWVGT